MININKSTSITGSSTVNNGDKEILVAYLNANIDTDGNINITKSIINKEMFVGNYKEQVLEDFNKFEQYVYNFTEKEDIEN